jgi:hypothetical protein
MKNEELHTILKIVFFVAFGVFSSCAGNGAGAEVNEKDIEKEARAEFAIVALKEEHLRLPEEKMLMLNLETLLYEYVEFKGNKIVRIPGKEEFRKMGVPEKFYYVMKKDVEDFNDYAADTTIISHSISWDEAFQEAKQKYLERKNGNN